MVKYHNYQLKWWKEGITLLRTFTFVILPGYNYRL